MKVDAAMQGAGAARLVTRQNLEGRVDPFILNRMSPQRREFVIREVAPRLTWNRLDLAIKLFYLEQSTLHPASFAEELYDAHIHAFSLGDFREPGNATKRDAKTFRSAFRDILESMRVQGFDPAKSLIPVASDGSFINGGHRAACAMLLRHPVHVVETGLPPVRYDHQFFRSRGMSDDLLEAAVVKYVERSPRARVALIRSPARAANELAAIVGEMIHEKKVVLSSKGTENLLSLLTDAQGWRGAAPEPRHVRHRRLPGLSGDGLRFVLQVFDCDEGRFRDLTERTSGLSSGGDQDVLIPDTRESTLDLARLLLNDRSTRFLNEASPSHIPGTITLAARFREALDGSGIPREMAVLGPGMVLAAHGVRETRQVDFMSPLSLAREVASPDFLPQPCGPEVHDILQDPRRHLHFWGLKFLSVAEAMDTLTRRASPRDAEELQHLKALLPPAGAREFIRSVIYRARFHRARVRRSAIHALMRLGLQGQAKLTYDKLRRRRR